MEYKIGDVLWQMQAREQNGICKWKAVPHSIEVIDDRKVLFENGCGGSRSSIENHWFLTRQEAIDDFLKKHESLEIPLPEVTDEEKNVVTHLPRTDFQDLEVIRFDSITETSVYVGGMDRLVNITDKLKWHTQYVEALCMDVGTLTLSEIYEQAKEFNWDRMLTVFVESSLEGVIYQCGNYEDGKWVKYGTTRGYA